MNVWFHLSTIFSRRHALPVAGLIALCVAITATLFFGAASQAAPGVNQTLSFQGRLLNSSGGVVPDGYYNMQFKIYQDGAGTAAGNSGGTLEWTENYVNNGGTSGIQVKNGYFSVTLGANNAFGSSIDWNQDTLWLSMNVAGTATACSTFGTAPCTADGEMLPMKRLTSTPYALNAGRLGGLTSDGFIQNSTSPQTADFNITGTGVAGTIQATTTVTTPAIDRADAGSIDIGTTNATSINLNQDVTVAAGQSLTLAGGNTASRPGSPTEGMLYYDTDAKQLLTYANGKWQGESKTATKIVAASNSSQAVKDGADYVADGTGDQTEINSALTAAAGGKVYLAEGTYTISSAISVPNNTTLAGAGAGTVITVTNSFNTSINAITNTTTGGSGTGITIQDLKLDGNRANQASGTMRGIYLDGVGSGSGSSAVQGSKVTNIQAYNWNSYGIGLSSSSNNTISANAGQNNAYNIYVTGGARNTIAHNTTRGGGYGVYIGSTSLNALSDNTVEASSSAGLLIDVSADSNTITGNTVTGSSSGIFLNFADSNTITGNTSENNSSIGIGVSYSANNTISSNNIHNNAVRGVDISSSTGSTVSGNNFSDNGGSTTNESIYLLNADSNAIAGNTITDSSASTNNYAINVSNSGSDTNYLAGNTLGGGSIHDLGTGTVYGGQTNSAGNYVLQPAGSIELMKDTNVTGSLSASSSVLAPDVDRASSGTLTIGSTNATAITIGRTSANTATTFLGTAIFKPTTGNNSTTAFQLQRADGTAMFVADSTNQLITIGNSAGGNITTISTSTGEITKYGTARNTKKITLAAEYTGSVLDAGSGSNNTGTMTSSIDLTNRMNYYKWTTSQGTNQSYDVVVQVPLPTDFDGWASSNPLSITTYTSNTTNGTITLETRDSGGTVRCNFVSVTPGSTSTWATNNSACTLNTGTYTAGDYMTLRIRMQSPTSGDVRVGNINLSYLSKY